VLVCILDMSRCARVGKRVTHISDISVGGVEE